MAYSLVLALVAIAAGFTGLGGPAYWAVAVVLNTIMLLRAVAVWRSDETTAEATSFAAERKFFRFSLWYLFGTFSAMIVDASLMALVGLVVLIFALTVVKMNRGGSFEAFDHTQRSSITVEDQ